MLKGAARGVGAFDLGDAAADAEKTAPSGAETALLRLQRDTAAVRGFIVAFLKAPA
jgi:hypothetical protein